MDVGKQTHEFFNYTGIDSYGKKHYSLKPMEQYATEHRTKEQPSKQYFKQTKLQDIIMEYPLAKKNPKQSDIDKGEWLWPRSECNADMQKWPTVEHLLTLSRAFSTWIRSNDGPHSKQPSIRLSPVKSLRDRSR